MPNMEHEYLSVYENQSRNLAATNAVSPLAPNDLQELPERLKIVNCRTVLPGGGREVGHLPSFQHHDFNLTSTLREGC